MYTQYKKSRYPQPISIGFCINCFGQRSLTIERKLPKLVPLDAEKNSAQNTMYRKIDFGGSLYDLSYGGIVKFLRQEWARSIDCTAFNAVRESVLLSK